MFVLGLDNYDIQIFALLIHTTDIIVPHEVLRIESEMSSYNTTIKDCYGR